MVPMLRLTLLLATQLSPLGANPLLHIQAPSLAVELLGQVATHELPPGLAFLLDSHAEHLTRTVVVGLAIGVRAEQFSMPPLFVSLHDAHLLPPVDSSLGKYPPVQVSFVSHVSAVLPVFALRYRSA